MTGVRTHSLTRSLRAMTYGTVKDHQAVLERVVELGLQELDQQYQLPIVGTISEGEAVDITTTVTFDSPFVDGYDQRHSYLTDPLFTYGTILTSGPPLLISAHVRQWIESDGYWTGARIQVVVYWPGPAPASGQIVNAALIDGTEPFVGEVHLNFQGYGAPDPDDYGDD